MNLAETEARVLELQDALGRLIRAVQRLDIDANYYPEPFRWWHWFRCRSYLASDIDLTCRAIRARKVLEVAEESRAVLNKAPP